MLKDINVYNTKKFQANLLKKFNAIKNILNDLSVNKFLKLEISENGIGLVEHKNIELLIKVLKAFDDFPDLKNFKLVAAINQVKNINNIKDLRTKYKLFKKAINPFTKNFENYEIDLSNNNLSVFLMDFLVYVLRLMYLEYENSSLIETVETDDGKFDTSIPHPAKDCIINNTQSFINNVAKWLNIKKQFDFKQEKDDDFMFHDLEDEEVKKFNNFFKENFGIDNLIRKDLCFSDFLALLNDIKFKFKFEFKKLNSGLFVNGDEPKASDVKQGLARDCYLMAILISLCDSKTGRESIKKCFVNKETFLKDNYVKIRLYKVQLTYDHSKEQKRILAKKNGRTIIKLDKSELGEIKFPNCEISFHNAKNVPWVKLLEKAFTVYRTNSFVDYDKNNKDIDEQLKSIVIHWNNYGEKEVKILNIEEGYGNIVSCAITGCNAYSCEKNNENYKNDKDYKNLFETIKKKLNKGLPVTVSKKNSDSRRHLYSVCSVNEENGEKTIVIRNPYNGDKEIGMNFSKFASDYVVDSGIMHFGKKYKNSKKIEWVK